MKRLLLLYGVLALFLFSSEGASALRDLQEGMEVPTFSVSDIAGKTFSYQELAGKKGSLLIFWQTTSKNSGKALRQIQERHAAWEQKGLNILAINVEEQNISADDLKAIKAAAEQLSFPVYVDRGLVVFDKLGVIALPTMVLMDDKMVIQRQMSGLPLVGSQIFWEEVGYFLGEKKVVAKEVYKPVRAAFLSYQMGLKFEKQKNSEKAADVYEKAVAADPAFMNPFIRLVDIYLRSKRVEAVKALLAKADKRLDDNPALMLCAAKLAYHEGNMERAKKMIAESLAKEETPDAYVYSGFISSSEGQHAGAETAFNHAIELSHGSPEVLRKIGRFFSEKDEYAKANAYYKQALEEIFRMNSK
jgi:tetratricopeptide (TPR) repeat protein